MFAKLRAWWNIRKQRRTAVRLMMASGVVRSADEGIRFAQHPRNPQMYIRLRG